MAEMIPDRLPSKASMGEKRLFEYLQILPENFIIYYEPIIEQQFPDFIILAPEFGILLIEVKGWRINDLVKIEDQQITLKERGQANTYPHPFQQAASFIHYLKEKAKKHSTTHILLTQDKKNFAFPIHYLLILANINQEQGQKENHLQDLSIHPNVITRERFLTWESLSTEDLITTLKSFIDKDDNISSLDPAHIDPFRTIIHPDIKITPHLIETEHQLKTLDLKQERNARALGNGHRIIYGVAGSGKTILLIARARFLSQQQPFARILVLCFNVTLASYLKDILSDCLNVYVTHFDGWCRGQGIAREIGESNTSLGEKLLLFLQEGRGESGIYDAVLIDEAQDFDPCWFQCVLEAMKEPFDGDLLIVADGNQGIYRKGGFNWQELGIRARGRTISKQFDLDKNYRNTKEIISLAAHFGEYLQQIEDDDLLGIPLDPNKASRSLAYPPKIFRAANREDEILQTAQIVNDLLLGKWGEQTLKEPIRPEEIGILYPYAMSAYRPLLDKLRQTLLRIAPTAWLNEDSISRYRASDLGIKIQTMTSSKGLQYKAVILLWADLYPSSFENSHEETEKRILYVGLTRAEELLYISYSEESEYIDILREYLSQQQIPIDPI